MPSERFYIGPMDIGQQNNLRPYSIPDTAYESITNAYVWRGRVRKRFGAKPYSPGTDAFAGAQQLQSRFRVALAGAVAGDAFHGFVPLNGGVPQIAPAVGQMFSILGSMFTVNVAGAPVANLLRSDGSGLAATFTFNTGAVDILLPPGTVPGGTLVYYYPSLPVMALAEYETVSVNDEITIGFDSSFAYSVNNDGWYRLATGNDFWTGGNADFFWTTSWRGVLPSDNLFFASNFVTADGIRFWNGATWTLIRWAFLENPAGTFHYVDTARIIVPFKNRLLLLNTVENGAEQHTNRCRFSWIGDPIHQTAGIYDAFREDIPGVGGWEDVPVQEAIVTVQNLRDRLIVYCERSTWELVPTGVDIRPFVFQQINTELGAESTFSQIAFDQAVLGVGNVGIHACDGNSVKRIDSSIPDEVFWIHNINDGIKRISGIRDFSSEMAYWTFPSQNRDTQYPFPDRILIFNYLTSAWSFNDDSFTTFGYIQSPILGSGTWQLDTGLWQDDNSTWQDAFFQARSRDVIAGNQEGYVFIIDVDVLTNAPALQITDIATNSVFTVINHNLKQGEFIKINDCVGFIAFNNAIHMVESVVDRNTFTLAPIAVAGYLGGGTITRVSKIDILSKRYNFYGDKGNNVAISKIDFLVDKTTNGAMTFDYRVSNSQQDMQIDAATTGALLGSAVLETSPYALIPAEQNQQYFWHAMYPQAQGEFIQIHLTMSDAQMVAFDIDPVTFERSFVADNDFELSGVIYLASPLTRF